MKSSTQSSLHTWLSRVLALETILFICGSWQTMSKTRAVVVRWMVTIVAALGMASPAMVGKAPNDTVPFGGTTAMGIHAWTAMQDRIRRRMAFFMGKYSG